MKLEINPLAAKMPQYEIDKDTFNKIMNMKKTTDRYDIHGSKRVRVTKGKAKVTTFGRHTPTRIKSEYMKGPYALVCLLTAPERDPDNPDSYMHTVTILFEEGEATRIYRDSLNDGFVDAKFCDDTILPIIVQDMKTREEKYIQLIGEPTGYGSWKFEEEETINQHNNQIMLDYAKQTSEKFNLPLNQVFVVIQLDV